MKRSLSYLQAFRSLSLLKGKCSEHIHALSYPASEDSRGVVNNTFLIFNRLHKVLLVSQDRKRPLLITILPENLESPIESKGYFSWMDLQMNLLVGIHFFLKPYKRASLRPFREISVQILSE